MIQRPCLVCEQLLDIHPQPEIGDKVQCGHCGAWFEIIWLYPLAIDDLHAQEDGQPDDRPSK